MKFPAPVTVKWIAQLIGASRIEGDETAEALGINELHKVEKGDLVFVDAPKYYDTCLHSAATHIIINTAEVNFPEGKTLLVTDNPFEAYLKIVNHFRPFTSADKMVSDHAAIGEGTVVMPGVFIGKEVTIGKNCRIFPNVTILDYTEIGDNVVIQSGTVIGGDAFYYNTKKDREVWYRRMQSCGNVVVEDDVEIGCNCTIDRGVTGSTIIGKGTKIDNLVHVGHDNSIGKNCLFAAQVGIAGATVIEEGVCLWGQVGVNKTLTIGANTQVLAQSGVRSSLQANSVYFGYPAEEAQTKKRDLVWQKRIPEIWEDVRQIKKTWNEKG